jgi:citrate lyase subunit beta/citryl-CoA lyase
MVMLRSFLFSPASNARRVDKALSGEADAVIIDLEDAVAVAEKPAARAALPALLEAPRSKQALVRINALGTEFALPDLLAAVPARPDGIVLPKAESAADILTIDWAIGQIERQAGLRPGSMGLVPIVETAKGVAAAGAIAAASPRTTRIALGSVDLALDMECDLDDEAGMLAHARFAVSVASRAAGLEGPIDAAFIDVADSERLKLSAGNGRRLGFTAKFCIHPSQVPVVNATFSPTVEDIARAERIVAGFEAAEREGRAALMVDGLMVDYPVVVRARRLLGR